MLFGLVENAMRQMVDQLTMSPKLNLGSAIWNYWRTYLSRNHITSTAFERAAAADDDDAAVAYAADAADAADAAAACEVADDASSLGQTSVGGMGWAA